ncbi:tail fiber domain-containing protein [Hymenobacter sp. B81]|uniref:tail fiber domain-containing protein n=1 Tax=Hymenobacter sp. B81 TaxID=3344878 RepID=UPI0037DC50E8
MKHLAIPLLLAAVGTATAQNVGIGTSNPTRAKLEVHGVAGTGATSAIFGADGQGISLQRNWPAIGFNQYNSGLGRYLTAGHAAALYLNPTSGGLYFDLYSSGPANGGVFGTVRPLSLFSGGNVSVRNAPNLGTLTVARGTSGGGTAVFMGTTNHSRFNYATNEHTYIRGGRPGSYVYLNDIAGGKVLVGQFSGGSRLGINSANPVYTLEVVQTANRGLLLISPEVGFHNWEVHSQEYSRNRSTCLEFKYDDAIKGWFRPTDGGYTQNSDRRLKTRIEPLGATLPRLLQLQPVRYQLQYHNPDNQLTYGLIAQDVQPLFPELVEVRPDAQGSYDGLKELYGINYAQLGVVAVKAIQEQQLLLGQQSQEIAELKTRLAALEQQLTKRR